MTATAADDKTYIAPSDEVHNHFMKLRGGHEYEQFAHSDDRSSVSLEHMENHIKKDDDHHLVYGCDLNYGFGFWDLINSTLSLEEKVDCSDMAAMSFGSVITSETTKDDHTDHHWIYSANTDHHQSGSSSEASIGFKRQKMEDIIQPLKKQRGRTSSSSNADSSGKKKRLKASSSSKDPQSLAAKNRREKISERLKTLQELIPNGTKVDLVTMLEKAIGYVKFLQLQVKVLATDEFWPVDGKPPSVAQVKEAIDTILNSQNDKASSSK